MREVAEKAGVSTATVSRILSKKAFPLAVSEETRQRVFDTVRDLGYRPNRVAQSLMTNRMNVLGLSLPGFFDPRTQDDQLGDMTATGYGLLLHGVQTEASPAGYDVQVLDRREYMGDATPTAMPAAIDLVDGLVYITPDPLHDAYTPILDAGIPLVMVGPNPTSRPVTSVCADNAWEVYRLVRSLLQKGHRRLGVFLPEKARPLYGLRRTGLELACRMEGIDVGCIVEATPRFTTEEADSAVSAVLAERPTAIVVTRPDMAFRVARGIEREGIRCPEEVEVVVYGDDFAFRLMKPGLSALDIRMRQVAAVATKRLLAEIEGAERPGEAIRVDAALIERDSCSLPGFQALNREEFRAALDGASRH